MREPWGDADVAAQLNDAKRLVAAAVPTRFFAAVVDGAIAGWCELRRRDGVAQIEDVEVLEELRGRGLGRAIVQHALDEGAARRRSRLPRGARRRLAARALREARLHRRRSPRRLHAAPRPADAPSPADTAPRAAPRDPRRSATAVRGRGSRDPRSGRDAVRDPVDGRARRRRLRRARDRQHARTRSGSRRSSTARRSACRPGRPSGVGHHRLVARRGPSGSRPRHRDARCGAHVRVRRAARRRWRDPARSQGNPQSLAVSRKLGYEVVGTHLVSPRGEPVEHTDVELRRGPVPLPGAGNGGRRAPARVDSPD